MKKGYVLLEAIVSLSVIVIITACLYGVIVVTHDVKDNIEDRIELSQQIEEIDYQIKSLIGECVNIISITTVDKNTINSLEYNKVYNVCSIKLNFKTQENKDNLNLKNKEISLKNNTNKLFVNTLMNNNLSESGGYEIGDYVKNVYIKLENPKLVSIVLRLSKNGVDLEKKLKLYIRYDGSI
ncbi:MAG: hypothetical protein ACI3VR_05650 [Intestinibacter sp.]|uniref:hypothetical protein n=1 Tax=Intestinibacter sp. TaxID=1965304 RepID=UPI003F161831